MKNKFRLKASILLITIGFSMYSCVTIETGDIKQWNYPRIYCSPLKRVDVVTQPKKRFYLIFFSDSTVCPITSNLGKSYVKNHISNLCRDLIATNIETQDQLTFKFTYETYIYEYGIDIIGKREIFVVRNISDDKNNLLMSTDEYFKLIRCHK